MLIAGLVLLAGSLLALATRYWRPGPLLMIGLSAFAPYGMLGAPLALIVFLATRHWTLAAAALALTVGSALTQLRLLRRTPPPPDTDDLVVMTSNLLMGRAEPADVVRAVVEHRVDLLLLQELTPELQDALTAAGLGDALPHHVSDPRAGAFGTGLWSRYPLVQPVRRADFACAFVTAQVDPSGRSPQLQVASLHLAGPHPDSDEWHRDIAHLPAVLAELVGSGGPAMVGGDFNATPDLSPYRRLLRDGWASAAEQAGAGITPTFPSGTRYPAMIAIDHVLTHGGPVGRSARTLRIRGTDHRALLVTLALPRRAA